MGTAQEQMLTRKHARPSCRHIHVRLQLFSGFHGS